MFGQRLKLARKRAGLSLRGLSEALDGRVSPQAIGKYERDEMMPSSRVLAELVRVLDTSADFLMSSEVQELEGVEFRKKARTTQRERNQVEAKVIETVERYLAVEEILGLDSAAWHQPDCKGQHVSSLEDADALALNVRKEWKLGIDPIPNMTELLERHGIKVLVLDLPENVSGLRCDIRRSSSNETVPVIVVNKTLTLERRRLTLGHELGHLVMDAASPCDHEKASQRFAGALLICEEHLKEEIGSSRNRVSYEEIIRLKRRYRVSAAAFVVRLRDIRVLEQHRMTEIFKTFGRTWRKKEPVPLEEKESEQGELEAPTRFRRLCLRALSEDLIGVTRACELLSFSREELAAHLTGPEAGRAGRRQ